MSAKFSSLADVKAFVFAGNATLTLKSLKTGEHITFKVNAPVNKDTGKREYNSNFHFVSVLTGSDNENSYSYIGQFRGSINGVRFEFGRKSRLPQTTTAVKTWEWFSKHLLQGNAIPAGLEVYHEGKCGRCARKLTVPSSIESGFGPECVGKFEALAA